VAGHMISDETVRQCGSPTTGGATPAASTMMRRPRPVAQAGVHVAANVFTPQVRAQMAQLGRRAGLVATPPSGSSARVQPASVTRVLARDGGDGEAPILYPSAGPSDCGPPGGYARRAALLRFPW
jgi:hypothetical protein